MELHFACVCVMFTFLPLSNSFTPMAFLTSSRLPWTARSVLMHWFQPCAAAWCRGVLSSLSLIAP